MTATSHASSRLRSDLSGLVYDGSALLGTMLQALALVGITTGALLSASSVLQLEHVSIVYLVPVLISATWWGAVAAILSAIAGVAASAFFFYPPIYDLRVSNPQQVVDLCLFICVAIVTSHLADKLRTHIASIERREAEMRSLYAFSRRLAVASTAKDIFTAVRDHPSNVIGRRVVLFESATETGTQAQAADGADVPEAVRAAAAQHPQGQAGISGIYCTDDCTGSTWLVRAVLETNAALGMLAVEMGRNPTAALEAITQRAGPALTDAAATLERLDVTRALEEANTRTTRDAFREALIGTAPFGP